MAGGGDVLAERIAEHDEYFCRVVNLVPAHLYLPKDEPEPNAKYYKVSGVRRVAHTRHIVWSKKVMWVCGSVFGVPSERHDAPLHNCDLVRVLVHHARS
jgi:hypothetical protein